MFTGIAEAMGSVRRLTRRGEEAVIEVETSLDLDDVRVGDSIAVSGVCLTVTATKTKCFTADLSAETLSRTTFRHLTAGDRVNLEKALRLGDRLGGHIVLGHVDGVGSLAEKTLHGGSLILGFEIEPGIDRYVVAKGSVAVDGISLTVNLCKNSRFYVSIIPHTTAGTTLGFKKAGDEVNIETDILARHIEKLMSAPKDGGVTLPAGGSAGRIDPEMLARYGFIK